ncbi:MAG: periplasmic heavy metal sensor [Candidatus Aminicenantes bacterium]|nr:periplasmic heavy metal sensor [Candidatus Aminicenantes bacterium]
MKRNVLIFSLILSVAINIGVFGSAGYRWFKSRGEEPRHRADVHSPMSAFCKKLGLSREQIREMESLREVLEPKIEEIKKELKEKRVLLINHLKESEPDREKINIELSEIESLQTDLQKIVIGHMLQEKKILSPEQQEIFFSIILKRLCPEAKHQGGDFFPLIKEREEECAHEYK